MYRRALPQQRRLQAVFGFIRIHVSFVDNIIFYQRPLKSKKSLIDNCPYEEHTYTDKKTGEVKTAPIKCVAKSNPLFQEFRLWQFVQNIKIFERKKMVNGSLKTDVDVTDEFISDEDSLVRLFDFLNDRKDITQNVLLNTFFKIKKPKGKDSEYPYRWNYVEDKTYPCNETHAQILKGLKDAGVKEDFLTKDKEYRLWHILYSVEDKQEIRKAMNKFAEKTVLAKSLAKCSAQCRRSRKTTVLTLKKP